VETKKFTRGEVIFREGDESSEAYRLLSGEVEISINTTNGARSLARLTEGAFFGEMSLIDDQPRSATATALTDCEAEVISEENFSARVLEDPTNLEHYLRTLFDRLRATDALLQWHLNRSATNGHSRSTVESAIHAGAEPARPAGHAPLEVARLHLKAVPGNCAGTDLALRKVPFRIGRATQGGHGLAPLAPNDLSIVDQKPYQISRNHCVIERSGETHLVRDLGSRLGTIVNGTPLGIDFGSFVAPLQQGENVLVLGAEASPHRFTISVA
jgi:hypothetical protein